MPSLHREARSGWRWSEAIRRTDKRSATVKASSRALNMMGIKENWPNREEPLPDSINKPPNMLLHLGTEPSVCAATDLAAPSTDT